MNGFIKEFKVKVIGVVCSIGVIVYNLKALKFKPSEIIYAIKNADTHGILLIVGVIALLCFLSSDPEYYV